MRWGRGIYVALLLTVLLAASTLPGRAQGLVIHTVRPGENLFRIALYYGTTVDAIRVANHLTTVHIYVGQRLVIPGAKTHVVPSVPLTPPPTPMPGAPTPIPTPAMPDLDARTYIVQRGDTLSAIAARYGLSIWALIEANGLRNWNLIYVGQKLTIPAGTWGEDVPTSSPQPVATGPPSPHSVPATYTVHRGDTLARIAARFGTTVYALAQLNGIANPSMIYVGQVLRLSNQAEPVVAGAGKLIVVDLSEQHLYAYEGDQLVFSFVASTGAAPYYTRVGEYRVQSKVPNAYGATWNIWMPHWLGIYWAGSLENGIHALPILSNGQVLWEGYLGTPISYGCIVLGTHEAELLYNWAEIGTSVSIRY